MSFFVTRRATCPKCRAVFRQRWPHCPIDGHTLTPLPQDPLVGTRLGDRYAIDCVLADGAAARKYAATDQRTGAQCVVKVLYGDYAAVRRHRRRFRREIAIGRRVCHPNVLAVIDSGQTAALVPYLVTLRVEGTALSSLIERSAPLGKLRALRILADLAAGIAHLHERGIVHCGLTGDSVFVSQFRDSEAALIADLDGAYYRNQDTQPEPCVSVEPRHEALPGTYISPQPAAGALDERCDLFNLGVLFYQLLFGRSPFPPTATAAASPWRTAVPHAMAARIPGLCVDRAAESIALKLMQTNPRDRFDNAGELLAALRSPTLVQGGA
jgi:eukaryotic-like serine/threonine-protein kinase